MGLIDWGMGSGADRLGSGADIILRLRSEAGRLGLGSEADGLGALVVWGL